MSHPWLPTDCKTHHHHLVDVGRLVALLLQPELQVGHLAPQCIPLGLYAAHLLSQLGGANY